MGVQGVFVTLSGKNNSLLLCNTGLSNQLYSSFEFHPLPEKYGTGGHQHWLRKFITIRFLLLIIIGFA